MRSRAWLLSSSSPMASMPAPGPGAWPRREAAGAAAGARLKRRHCLPPRTSCSGDTGTKEVSRYDCPDYVGRLSPLSPLYPRPPSAPFHPLNTQPQAQSIHASIHLSASLVVPFAALLLPAVLATCCKSAPCQGADLQVQRLRQKHSTQWWKDRKTEEQRQRDRGTGHTKNMQHGDDKACADKRPRNWSSFARRKLKPLPAVSSRKVIHLQKSVGGAQGGAQLLGQHRAVGVRRPGLCDYRRDQDRDEARDDNLLQLAQLQQCRRHHRFWV